MEIEMERYEGGGGINVAFCVNDRYSAYVATTIASFCHFTKSFIHFYVIESDMIELHKQMIRDLSKVYDNFDVKFIRSEIDKYKNLPQVYAKAKISKDVYNRILIPELIEVDKIIYSDVDVMATGDISELWNENLGDNVVGMVKDACYNKDFYNVFGKTELKMKAKLIKVDLTDYFYSGMILIDCKKWREGDFTKKIFDCVPKAVTQCIEQDAISMALKGKIQPLDIKYCYTSRYCYITKIDNCVIRHFEGKNKPWHAQRSNCLEQKIDYLYSTWWYFASKTEFYSSLLNDNIVYIRQQEISKCTFEVKLFNHLLLFSVKKLNNKVYVKLFNCIPLFKKVKK